MNAWQQRLLSEFVPELARLWIAVDPDGVLLDESVLAALRQRGFDLLDFEDSVAFRAQFEARYRAEWRCGRPGPATAVILHLRSEDPNSVPWDYLRDGRRVQLSLADLFPELDPSVVRRLDVGRLARLFDAQMRHASQVFGNAATQDFVLEHVFKLSPYLFHGPTDLWRELLRFNYAGDELPERLAEHVESVLDREGVCGGLPVAEFLRSRDRLIDTVQRAWRAFLVNMGVAAETISDVVTPEPYPETKVPFADPGVWSTIDSMFLAGALRPVHATSVPSGFPDRFRVGVVQNLGDQRALVAHGTALLRDGMPSVEGSHREWLRYAHRLGELLARFHALDEERFQSTRADVEALQLATDTRLTEWATRRYADLPSVSAARGPVMLHHVPRFLDMQRQSGTDKIALLVFDALAIDQWATIRQRLSEGIAGIGFEDGACFAWLPTLTSVSRQAVFSGLRPREFPASIYTTDKEPALWRRFWADHGVRDNEQLYRKGIKHVDQLDPLLADLSAPGMRVAGIVVDMVDELVHGAQLGKRGIAREIDLWCQSGFVDRLFTGLHELGFTVYVTADHGNVDAVGNGRINEGTVPELRSERVRVYRSDVVRDTAAAAHPSCVHLPLAGLPRDFLPLFAGPRTAFVSDGERLVAHGGISVEELIVPFVKVSWMGDQHG